MTVKSTRRSAAFAAVLALAAAPFLTLTSAHSAPGDEIAIYSSVPQPHPISSPSLAFNTQNIQEYGATAILGGTERELGRVEIGFVSWACETGYYHLTPTNPCVTTPGSGFTHPITANVYAENEDGTLGGLLGTVTREVFVPYRPSADTQNCQAEGNDARFYDAATGTCHWGLYFTASFDFSSLNLTLPDRVIVTAVFNTSTTGYEPIGVPGPYDVLNMAIAGPTPSAGIVPPSVGEFADAMFTSWSRYGIAMDDGPLPWGGDYMPHIALYSTEPGVDPGSVQPTPPGLVDTAVAGLR